MKFDVSKVVSGCRLGRLSDFAQSVEKTIETPTAMIYTRAGKRRGGKQGIYTRHRSQPHIDEMKYLVFT
jgi:hypothetical protein